MNRDDYEFSKLVDPETEVFLAPDGLPGFSAAVAVDVDGVSQLWLIDRDQLGVPGVDHGEQFPRHELTGPLPRGVRARVMNAAIRCGRPTASGRPCRGIVATLGTACGHHREAIR